MFNLKLHVEKTNLILSRNHHSGGISLKMLFSVQIIIIIHSKTSIYLLYDTTNNVHVMIIKKF